MKKNTKYIEINSLTVKQCKNLSQLLLNENKNYIKYFTPFNFDENTLIAKIKSANLDRYYGVFINNHIVGFYMLRGFDAGFVIPSYGVYISTQYSSLGLSKLTLQHAISTCKLNLDEKIMLKVHPENKIAKHIYESFGFKKSFVDNINKNIIYLKDLSQ